MTTVTVDTNGLDSANVLRLQSAAEGHDVVFAAITVSERELQGSDIRVPVNQLTETAVWDESQWDKASWAEPVNEVLVIGESPIGKAVLANSTDSFEVILKVITNGSFPARGKRDRLTPAQRRQLRDAMIFEAHVREGRDIFVSNDEKAFVGKTGDARRILEQTFDTRIMTITEFWAYCGQLAVGESPPKPTFEPVPSTTAPTPHPTVTRSPATAASPLPGPARLPHTGAPIWSRAAGITLLLGSTVAALLAARRRHLRRR